MTLWEICVNNSPYSHFYCLFRSLKRAQEVIAGCREQMRASNGPQAYLPENVITRRYQHTALDRFGN